MRIAYFHRISFPESEARFIEEARSLGFELVLIKYRELSLIDTKIYWKGMDIAEFDGWYFRSVGKELEWAKLLDLYARKNRIKVIDDYLISEGPLRRAKSVMGWQLLNAGVNYPRTRYVERLVGVKKLLENAKLPIVVKVSQGGRHGIGTFWVRSMDDIAELENRPLTGSPLSKGRGFLVQEFIPNDGDFRVMTVGYKVIGGFKRAPKEKKLVMNKSLGKSIAVELPNEIIAEAEKAARAVEVEIAGIDLVRDSEDGKIYVIEVNEAPQFKVFEKRTKVNAAREIMSYLKTKFETENNAPLPPLNLRGGERSSGELLRVLVLGRFSKEYEPKRILEEARKLGKADVIKYGAVKITENGVELPKGKKLSDYGLIVARSASKKGSSMVTVKTMVLLEARRLKIPVVNGESFLKYPLLGKTEQGMLLNKAGLPAVEFITFGSRKGWEEIIDKGQGTSDKLRLPVMVKGRFGSHGRTVKLVKDNEEFKKLIENYKGENVLIQPVLPVRTWFRAIVCRGEYLGEMKHTQRAKYRESAESADQQSQMISGDDMARLKEICLAAAKLFECDYCGIDVGWREDKKDWVIFEVNRTAQFQFFEKRTGVNVAAKMLELCNLR